VCVHGTADEDGALWYPAQEMLGVGEAWAGEDDGAELLWRDTGGQDGVAKTKWVRVVVPV
jgi:hypothetical protein